MPNRLAQSTSPYLRQHAGNPVDWYEWGPLSLSRAKAEDKPILLSVGYSACHWCHVMADESFDDRATAERMNENFVNIKVDREERPDIDAIYQRVVQLMGEGGGWPLTVFLTPDQEPFYGGTYFPPEPRYGRPSFTQLLDAMHQLYHHDKARVAKHTRSFREGFAALAHQIDEQSSGTEAPGLEHHQALGQAVERLLSRIDPQWGGFGQQPKFPNPTALDLLDAYSRTSDIVPHRDPLMVAAREAFDNTLEKMAQGGIYDHLRGGFARYSVDQVWLVPHFEKMLYDNAQLLALYAENSARAPLRLDLLEVTRQTVGYLEADMQSPTGTFYAATDADSEDQEGKYFCWTPDQIRSAVGDASLADLLCAVYGVSERGNFEHGWSVLHRPEPLDDLASQRKLTRAQLDTQLERGRAILLEHRYTRIPPLRDEKVLTSWNALMISGLARTSAAMQVRNESALAQRCLHLATTCASQLIELHVDSTGQVLRAQFEGHVHTRGYLDDVAFLGRACLDLHELTLDTVWHDRAYRLASYALDHFGRPSGDGFFLTADEAQPLVDRIESQHDGPIPSGLGVMVELLLRLDASADAPAPSRTTVLAVLDRFRAASGQPLGFASLLRGARYAATQATHVTLQGPMPSDPMIQAFAARVRALRLKVPYALSLSFRPGPQPCAVVCRQQVCQAPIRHPEALEAEICR